MLIFSDASRARTLVEYCGGIFERNMLDRQGRDEAKQLHIEITTQLSGEARSVRQVQPRATRDGLDYFVQGESPEEIEEKRKQTAKKKKSDVKWEKAFGLSVH